MIITIKSYTKIGIVGDCIRFSISIENNAKETASITVECSKELQAQWQISDDEELFYSLYTLVKGDIISAFEKGIINSISGLLPLQYSLYDAPAKPNKYNGSLPDTIEVKSVGANTDIAIDGTTSMEKLEDLLKWPAEDDKLEWKEFGIPKDAEQRASLARAIIAMANTNGGYIILGKKNDGSICGITETLVDANDILQKVNPLIMPKIIKIKTAVYTKDRLNIGLVYVPPSDEMPHITIGDCSSLKKDTLYTRKAGQSNLADYNDFQRISNIVFKRKLSETIKDFEKTPIMSHILDIKESIKTLMEIVKGKEGPEEKSILDKLSAKEISLIDDDEFKKELERWRRTNGK